jgi:ABC-type dipeptide/oligopeptide/nickel transport system permease subunit
MEKLGINKKSVRKSWYKFSKNPLSIIGLVVVLAIFFITIFANIIAPYPKHAEWFTDFPNAKLPPSLGHPFGTDTMGRDVLSRVMFGFRYSLMMAMIVLVLVVPFHILIREILPNTLAPIFTKMTLDVAWVILIGASLSFIGLGAQPPTPDLGTMVSDGYRYMPELWWISIFPSLAIVFTILGFNLLGDGIRDMLAAEAY